MSDLDTRSELRGSTPYLKFDDSGRPFLQGGRCDTCGAVYLGEREHCANCTARSTIEPYTLPTRGRLYNYTIVYRSYPGIKVPFISAIVDLDGGGTLKGNLLDVEPTPESVPFGMPVEIVFRDASIANPAAAGVISHFFTPDRDTPSA